LRVGGSQYTVWSYTIPTTFNFGQRQKLLQNIFYFVVISLR
jgi:hypothetical protein